MTSQMQSAATKLETPDIETPQSVSIVTRDQFEEQGATSVRQAVSYTLVGLQQPDRGVKPL